MTSTNLASRVQEADAQQRAGLDVTPKTVSIFDKIRARRTMYDAVLRTVDRERFVRIAVKAAEKVAGCTEQSVLGSLMLSAQLDLEPGTLLGHAHLVPFGRECTFIVGYQGYVELARRAGYAVYAEAVFEGDVFDWQLGLDRNITHRPIADDRTDYAKLTHVYAVAQSISDRDAPKSFVVMTKAQIEVVRQKSKGSAWKSDPIPMAIKTPVRRLSKWMPMAIEVAQAANVDGAAPSSDSPSLDEYDPDVIDVRGTAPAPQQLPPPVSDDAAAEASPQPAEGLVVDLVEQLEQSLEIDAGVARAQTLQERAAELVKQIDPKARPAWAKWKRDHGLSNTPKNWSDDAAQAVIAWIESPLDAGGN